MSTIESVYFFQTPITQTNHSSNILCALNRLVIILYLEGKGWRRTPVSTNRMTISILSSLPSLTCTFFCVCCRRLDHVSSLGRPLNLFTYKLNSSYSFSYSFFSDASPRDSCGRWWATGVGKQSAVNSHNKVTLLLKIKIENNTFFRQRVFFCKKGLLKNKSHL